MDDKYVVIGIGREFTDTPDVPFLVYNTTGKAIFFGSIEEAVTLKKEISDNFSDNQYRIGKVVLEDDAFDLTAPSLEDQFGPQVTQILH